MDDEREDMQDMPEDGEGTVERAAVIEALSRIISKKRDEAVRWREQSGIETIWAKCEQSYEGYDEASEGDVTSLRTMRKPTTMDGGLRSSGKSKRSRVFMNITRPYVDAAAARVSDMLLPTEDKPWGLEETSIPKLSPFLEDMTPIGDPEGNPIMLPDEAAQPDEAGQVPLRSATMADKAKVILQEAKQRAEKASNQIEDWLQECRWTNEVRKVINDAAKLGTGILKGPVPVKRRRRAAQQDEFGNIAIAMLEEVSPDSKRVDPWDFFVDPAAGENHQEGNYVIERDRLTERKLMDLADLDGYFNEAVEQVIEEGPGRKYADRGGRDGTERDEMYEVWYYHGALKRKDLEDLGIEIPEEIGSNNVMAIVTLVNDTIIKAALSPLDSGEFPYDVMHWQRRAGMVYGIGVAEQGGTAQRMLTSSVRALMDNMGLSVGPQVIRRQGAIVPADGVNELVPLKQWLIPPDADVQDVQQAMMFINVPSMQAELMGIVQFALKFMEDSTGLPMLLQGQQAGATDTVGGMILLNNNAGTVLRHIARTFDDSLTEPHISRYYDWLMMYGPEDCKGDMTVKTYGSSALVERDVANQDIQFIGQLIPQFQLFGIDPEKWFAEWAKSRRLSPDAFQMDEAKKQQLAQGAQQQGPSPQQITAEASMQVAQIRSQTEMGKAQLVQESDMAELQFKAAEAERARQHEASMKRMELQMRMMEFAESRGMALEQIKAQLAIKAQDSRDKRELFVAERAVKQQMGSGI